MVAMKPTQLKFPWSRKLAGNPWTARIQTKASTSARPATMLKKRA